MSKHAAGRVPKIHILDGSSSDLAADIKRMSLPRTRNKLKSIKVVPHNAIEIDEDDDQDGVVIIGESLSHNKNKQPMKYGNGSKSQVQVVPHDVIEIDEDDQDGVVIIGESHSNNKNKQPMKYGNVNKNQTQAQPPEMPTMKPKLIIEDEIDVKYKAFKQFDTVQDYSDHHFSRAEILKLTPAGNKPGKDWAKRIQHEWKVLEKDLPETIYVRIYEDRMDILRAVIIGPAGTPYHDGLFFFDIYFPSTYPLEPPKVHYHSGGLRLNPNLYECGKVCLSLLNTWSGQGCENWNSSNSTMLQVLVSIQALVLNTKPYFNEPGYAASVNTAYGEKESLAYNETAFILSCKTMLYSLRKPPKHFEDFVAGYFRSKGHTILVACNAYIQGARVGCVVGDGVQHVYEGNKSSSSTFKENLRTLFEQLLKEFTSKGADTDKLSLRR